MRQLVGSFSSKMPFYVYFCVYFRVPILLLLLLFIVLLLVIIVL